MFSSPSTFSLWSVFADILNRNLISHNIPPYLVSKPYVSVVIKIQPDTTVRRNLFTAKSRYIFPVSQHSSSGVLKTVTAASGTGHNTGTATSLQRGLIGTDLSDSHKPVPIRPRLREVALSVLWPVPEAAITVFSTPDDVCCNTGNMYSDFAVNKFLRTVVSG